MNLFLLSLYTAIIDPLLRLDAPSAVHNLRLIWQRVEPPSHRYGGPRDNHLGVRRAHIFIA
jgi:hypothetical protein